MFRKKNVCFEELYLCCREKLTTTDCRNKRYVRLVFVVNDLIDKVVDSKLSHTCASETNLVLSSIPIDGNTIVHVCETVRCFLNFSCQKTESVLNSS